MEDKKTGVLIVVIDLMVYLGIVIGGSFCSYLMTDVANIGISVSSSIMTMGNIICSVLVLFGGMLITNTHTKAGQYRPWLLLTYTASSVGILILTFHMDNLRVGIIVAALGFMLYMMGTLLQGTAKFGLYMKLAGDNNDARTLFSGRSFTGNSIGVVISGVAVMPLVSFFGQRNESTGWFTTQLLFIVITMTGVFILIKMTKSVDTLYLTNESIVDKVSLFEQVKSLILNRAALMVFLSDIFRYGGSTFTAYTTAYYFSSIVGDINLVTFALTATGIAGIIGALIAPVAVKIVGGRKKMAIIGGVLATVPLIIAAFSQASYNYIFFVGAFVISSIFKKMTSSVVVPLYTDAGEYWLSVKGVDTRPFLVASQNSGYAIGAAMAGALVGLFLNGVGYEAGIMLTGAAAKNFIMWAGLIPAICIVLSVVCLLIHNLSDKQVEEHIKKNAKAGY